MVAKEYRPAELAESILTRLEQMEQESNKRPHCTTYRKRTGLTCAAEFRGRNPSDTENAITAWLAESFIHAQPQVRDIHPTLIPDIVFAYERDERGSNVLVLLEAKPIWQTWITDGAKRYSGTTTDYWGRSTGNYCSNNIRQFVGDRDKMLSYTSPNFRHMLLALIFQRPDEVDTRVIQSIGPDWQQVSRHIVDLCNPPGDNIGMTAMVFWPR